MRIGLYPWIYTCYINYPKTFNRSVFDIHDTKDVSIVNHIYGDRTQWVDITTSVETFESNFPKLVDKLKILKDTHLYL
jgi:hypothetical protein